MVLIGITVGISKLIVFQRHSDFADQFLLSSGARIKTAPVQEIEGEGGG